MNLEVVTIPVSDVTGPQSVFRQLGWRQTHAARRGPVHAGHSGGRGLSHWRGRTRQWHGPAHGSTRTPRCGDPMGQRLAVPRGRHAVLGRVDAAATPFASASNPARCGARRPRMASTRSASAGPTRTGLTGTPRTWLRTKPGRNYPGERIGRESFPGGGAPVEHCAAARAAHGLRVALVQRELVGGECSYGACIPSKSLVGPVEAVQADAEAGARALIAAAFLSSITMRCGEWLLRVDVCGRACYGITMDRRLTKRPRRNKEFTCRGFPTSTMLWSLLSIQTRTAGH